MHTPGAVAGDAGRGRAAGFRKSSGAARFHHRAEALQTWFVLGRGHRAVQRIAVRGRHPRQVSLQIEIQPEAQVLGVTVRGRPIVAVVHPEHGKIRLFADHQMQ
jgi:hypothetical protein